MLFIDVVLLDGLIVCEMLRWQRLVGISLSQSTGTVAITCMKPMFKKPSDLRSRKARLTKRASAHTFRHSCASHLLQTS
jgi:integrase